MIPLVLVTGFLGAGKTTFLRQVARRHAGRRLVFLVNDFAAADVDGALVAAATDNVVAIPGGSIFCRCLVTEFIAVLGRIRDEFHQPTTPVEGVVIEASGMADPRVIGDLLRETRLDQHFAITRILALLDPGSFLKLLKTLPAVRAQVAAADTILLNKTDCYPAEQIAAAEAAARAINPEANLIRAVQAAADCELFAHASPAADRHGAYAPCRDPDYAAVVLAFDRPPDLEALAERLRAFGHDLLRAKGQLVTTAGPRYIDYSASGFQATPCP
ncbi:MAG: hypothetical protein K9N49_09785, partial [Candidatus Marinimicrobia bacterium]|nr:hypothetical protein [Candidatus Neomarinimicrobiota bacterium]